MISNVCVEIALPFLLLDAIFSAYPRGYAVHPGGSPKRSSPRQAISCARTQCLLSTSGPIHGVCTLVAFDDEYLQCSTPCDDQKPRNPKRPLLCVSTTSFLSSAEFVIVSGYTPGVDQYPSPIPLYRESNPTFPPSQLSFPIPHGDQSRGLLFTEYGCKVDQRISTGDGTLTPVFPMGNSVDGVSRPMFQRPKKKVASPEVIKASSMRRKTPGPAKYKCPRDGCGQDFTRNANLDSEYPVKHS